MSSLTVPIQPDLRPACRAGNPVRRTVPGGSLRQDSDDSPGDIGAADFVVFCVAEVQHGRSIDVLIGGSSPSFMWFAKFRQKREEVEMPQLGVGSSIRPAVR